MRPTLDPTSGDGSGVMPGAQPLSAPLAVLDPVPAHLRTHPSKLFVEVTTRCNLHCAMCVKYAPGQGLVEGDMTEETFERLSPAFPHLESLVLNGIGEPLLHRGLEGFIARAKASMPAGAWVGFQTNGQLIGPRRAEALVAAGVDRIAISADAVSPERLRSIHGGARLAPIEAAAGRLHDSAAAHGRRLSLGLEFVAMRDNLDQLPLLVRWATRHRFEFIIVSHLLAYDPTMAEHAAFSPVSDRALAVYRTWRSRAESEGIDLLRYLESRHRFAPPEEDERAIRLVSEMVADARARGISLRIDDLLRFDEPRLEATEAAFAEAASLAARAGRRAAAALGRTHPGPALRVRRGGGRVRVLGRRPPPVLLPVAPVRLLPRRGREDRAAAVVRECPRRAGSSRPGTGSRGGPSGAMSRATTSRSAMTATSRCAITSRMATSSRTAT